MRIKIANAQTEKGRFLDQQSHLAMVRFGCLGQIIKHFQKVLPSPQATHGNLSGDECMPKDLAIIE